MCQHTVDANRQDDSKNSTALTTSLLLSFQTETDDDGDSSYPVHDRNYRDDLLYDGDSNTY